MNPKTPTTAEVLAGILARIQSGEESPEDCAKYRHVAGEISAWGAKFAEALRIRDERKRRKSGMPDDLPHHGQCDCKWCDAHRHSPSNAQAKPCRAAD